MIKKKNISYTNIWSKISAETLMPLSFDSLLSQPSLKGMSLQFVLDVLESSCPLEHRGRKVSFTKVCYTPKIFNHVMYQYVPLEDETFPVAFHMKVAGLVSHTYYVWYADRVRIFGAMGAPQPILVGSGPVKTFVGSLFRPVDESIAHQVVKKSRVPIDQDHNAVSRIVWYTDGQWEFLRSQESLALDHAEKVSKIWSDFTPVKEPMCGMRKHISRTKYSLVMELKGKNVIDLCCGQGTDVEKWDKAQPAEVIFMDRDENILEKARERYTERPRNYKAQFLLIDINNFQLPSLPMIDCVWMSHAVHFLVPVREKIDAFFSALEQCMSPQSEIIFVHIDAQHLLTHYGSGKFTIGRYCIEYDGTSNYIVVSVTNRYSKCPEYLVYSTLFDRHGWNTQSCAIGDYPRPPTVKSPEMKLLRVTRMKRDGSGFDSFVQDLSQELDIDDGSYDDEYIEAQEFDSLVSESPLKVNSVSNVNTVSVMSQLNRTQAKEWKPQRVNASRPRRKSKHYTKREKRQYRYKHAAVIGGELLMHEAVYVLRQWGCTKVLGRNQNGTPRAQSFSQYIIDHGIEDQICRDILYTLGE